MITSIFFLSVAAVFNAVMDSVEHDEAFYRSVFSRLNRRWWCKSISWRYVKLLPFTKYRPDAWHLSKSLMVIFAIASVISYSWNAHWIIAVLVYGAAWNITFNFFYNRVFRL